MKKILMVAILVGICSADNLIGVAGDKNGGLYYLSGNDLNNVKVYIDKCKNGNLLTINEAYTIEEKTMSRQTIGIINIKDYLVHHERIICVDSKEYGRGQSSINKNRAGTVHHLGLAK